MSGSSDPMFPKPLDARLFGSRRLKLGAALRAVLDLPSLAGIKQIEERACADSSSPALFA
jgi:hypothetical protein